MGLAGFEPEKLGCAPNVEPTTYFEVTAHVRHLKFLSGKDLNSLFRLAAALPIELCGRTRGS